jgi:hypothetical protein
MRAGSALLFALAASCRGGTTDAPCGTAAGRFYMIAKADLDKVDDETRRAVEDQLPAMRDALDRACREDDWTSRVRNCLANAPNHQAFEDCERGLTEAQRNGLERTARGETRFP